MNTHQKSSGKKKYRHVFFDLDHTLWDFERNSEETLQELYSKYRLDELGVPSFGVFINQYRYRNDVMWLQYSLGEVDKETLRNKRFENTFRDLGLDGSKVPAEFSEEYIKLGPRKSHLIPYAKEMLDYLSGKYTLHIITNGFEETQHTKLASSGLTPYFDKIITSDKSGYKKPERQMFYYSLEHSGAFAETSIMIGDSLESDIQGAMNTGIDQVYFNPKSKKHSENPTYEIKCLSRLAEIL